MTSNLTDREKTQKDLLWGMYVDLRTHARHAETLRSNAVNLVLAVASALTAVITTDGRISRSDLPLSIAVALIGALGLAFASSYTELFQRNWQRAEDIRTNLDTRFFTAGDPTLAEMRTTSDRTHRQGAIYLWSRRLTGSTRRFWLTAPIVVMAVGASLTVIAA